MKITRTYQSKNKTHEIQVVAATNSIQLKPNKVLAIAEQFLEYAIQTPGLALIYDGSKNLLLLVESDFQELDPKSTTPLT